MDRGCLQEHFHLKQCRTTLKDDWARAQISIGLQEQPPVSSSAIFESCPTLFWVEMLLRSSPIHIWRENWGFIRVMFFGGCPLRPIDIWSLAQSSLNINMECLVSNYSPSHHLSIYETKMGASLGSGISQISIGLHGQPPKNLTLMNTQFSLQIWIGHDLRIIYTQNSVCINSHMTELDTGGCSWRPIDIWEEPDPN